MTEEPEPSGSAKPDDAPGGDAAGRVKLVWYVDFTNPHAPRIHDELIAALKRLDDGDVALMIRHARLSGGRDDWEIAARAAIAAGNQGKSRSMRHCLLAHEGEFTGEAVADMAKRIGLEPARFADDLESEATEQRLRRDCEGLDASDAHIAPVLFIDGRQYTDAWDETSLLEAIEMPVGRRIRIAGDDFYHWAASSGLVLVVATALALIFANVGIYSYYADLRDVQIGLTFDQSAFKLSLGAWINDGLMAVFFLLVGIEIKQELVDGELAEPSSAALPLIAALGGMIGPALIYVAINRGGPGIVGWGVPMATDIAFTIGILALLGTKAPASLKVFVSALAIADDLGAVVVIALFYGAPLHLSALAVAGGVFLAMLALNRMRVYWLAPYLLLGVALWYYVHESGLHATLAGVLTAAAIPSRRHANVEGIAAQTDAVLKHEIAHPDDPVDRNSIARLKVAVDRLREPGHHLYHALEGWTSFVILPLFAFFNTGIVILGASLSSFATPESIGVILGLVIGKPAGIFLFTWGAVRLGIARLSDDIAWSHVIGAGFLAGVGFTMSIFIATAAFEGSGLQSVKLAILVASTLAAAIGVLILLLAGPTRNR